MKDKQDLESILIFFVTVIAVLRSTPWHSPVSAPNVFHAEYQDQVLKGSDAVWHFERQREIPVSTAGKDACGGFLSHCVPSK